MRRTPWLAAALAALAALVAAVVAAVVAVIALRPELPAPCGHLLAEPRGELREDASVLRAAWTALTDPDADTVGELDGSRPVVGRTCLLYAGVLAGTSGPTVVLAETTVSGYTSLLRVFEVLLPAPEGGAARVGVTGMPAQLGSELRAGLVLPLSGAYLAPRRDAVDVTGVFVVRADGTAEPASAIGEGVYEPVPDAGAVLVLDRAEPYGDRAVVVPVVDPVREPAPPRRALRLWVGGTAIAGPAEAPALAALAAALPAVTEEPGFARLLDRWPPFPALALDPVPGGYALGAGEPRPGLPVFTVPATG